ncbi:hypothetical protein G6F60_009829 [Rhizopus arrhizus]|nr:hypothetical protein G6F60_009829 [Rhizopus arrhizus]
MDRNVADHKIDTIVDSFELYVEDNSDDDFQPIVTARERKISPIVKIDVGKGKATNSEATTTSSTGISTTDETIMFNKITLDDYDLEYSSDDFDAPVVKRLFMPSKPVPTAFNSAATSVKSSFCPVPIDKASDIKEGPKKISKRVMTIKTTVKNIWKSAYLQPLYDLVHTTNLLVTHTFAFTKRLISKYKKTYFEDAGYTPQKLSYAQQIAFSFWKHAGGLINKLFKKKEKAESLRGEMLANKSSSKAIKEAFRKKIYRPCNQVKLAIAKKDMPEVGLLDDQSRTQLNGFLSSYTEDYAFQKNSIQYGVMASPKNHFKTFFRLAELSEAEQTKQFACFPLRATFIPCYMTLDSKIIHYHVLKSKKNPKTGSRFETWGSVVDLNKKAFKHQGFQKSLRFQRILETNGVGVSIIKQNTDTSKNSPKPNTETKVDSNQTEHIEGLGQADLKSTEGKCVLVDPRRWDLMYCMKETSTAEERQTLIFTKNNRSKCSRSESSSVDSKKFVQYIKTGASVKNTLYRYYGNKTTKSKETYFLESEFDFQVDQKCNLYYGNLFIARICGFFSQPENYSTDSSLKPQLLDDSEKSKVLGLAKEMYRRPQQSNYKKTISTALEKLQHLPFRKLKFSSELFFKQNDQKLVRSLKAKFGQDAILIFGNWSAPNAKYQEPTRSKGLIRMLKKNRFVIYLIDEYKTSPHYLTCENELEKFKTVPNPRPYQRKKKPDVLCNGLLS